MQDFILEFKYGFYPNVLISSLKIIFMRSLNQKGKEFGCKYIVLITTKKTEGLRSLVLVAYMVWAINFIIDDWYLMVRWFAHRQTLQAAMAMLCSGAGRDVFCRFSFMASL